MDKLKKHIAKNRPTLDRIEQPNMDKMWSNIRAELGKEKRPAKKGALKIVTKKRGRQFTLWAMATAASLALIIGLGVGYLLNPKVVESEEFNLANYAPNLAKEAATYRKLVDAKMHEINFQQLDTMAFTEVLKELKEIDKEYENWTKDVPQYVREQELLDFLQRHYEQKIRILEILSKEIEKKQYHEERAIKL